MAHPPMTPREARIMVKRYYRAAHVGWLLAADAPTNKAKGKRLFETLPPHEKTIAERYRDHCLALYEGGGNG